MENTHNTETCQSRPLLTGKELEAYLARIFDHDPVITTTQFKRFLKISSKVVSDMREQNTLPRMIALTMGKSEGRFLVVDVARWIEERGFGDCVLGNSRHGRGRFPKLPEIESEALA